MITQRRVLALFFMGVTAVALALLGYTLAQAAMLHVNTLVDSTSNNGYCTLREAIINANDNAATWPDCPAGNGADTIYLTNLSGQITLLSDLPALTDPAGLTIQGPGAATLTISGNGFYRMFEVQNSAAFTLRDITLAHGSYMTDGSTIRAITGSIVEVWSSAFYTNTHSAVALQGGSLTVVSSLFQGNTGNGGAAIYAPDASNVLVDDSTFLGNQAGYGHAIFKSGGSLILNNSRFEQNGTSGNGFGTVDYNGSFDVRVTGCEFVENRAYQGAGLHDAGGSGTLRVENSHFEGNVASYAAGVIRGGGAQTTLIRHSTFIANSTPEQGGVINSYGPITVTASTFYSNTANMGGVIFTHNDASGPITVLDSYFQGNHATHSGGAIWYGRGLYITNSTFYGNTADYAGGATGSYEGWGEIVNSTFAHNGANNGASLYFSNGWAPPMTLYNTILANPQWGNNCHTYTGSYGDGGYNLQYPNNSCNPAIPILDPLLDPAGPQDNGGPTLTIALQTGSPAIDRIPQGADFPPTDQRGAPRPVDGDGNTLAQADSGAYELGGLVPAPTVTPQPTPLPTVTPTPTPVPILQLGKTAVDADAGDLLPGDTISYTIVVTNPYGFAVSDVDISDDLPLYTVYVPDSDTPEADADADPLVWSGQTIAPGVSLFRFAVTVADDAGGQMVANVACLTQIGAAQQCTEPVEPPSGGEVMPVLVLGKTAVDLNGDLLAPGDIIRYALTMTNPHAIAVTNVAITDGIPLHSSYVPDSDTPEADVDADPLVWSGLTMAPGATATFQFDVTINADAGGLTIVNVACFIQQDISEELCTTPVVPGGGGEVTPVLFLGKVAVDASGPPLMLEEVLSYTILITNPHPVTVTGVMVTDTIPAFTTYVADSDTPEADADVNPLVWSNLVVPPGVTELHFAVQIRPDVLGELVQNVACLVQPSLAQVCTQPVEPPGGGVVFMPVFVPIVLSP